MNEYQFAGLSMRVINNKIITFLSEEKTLVSADLLMLGLDDKTLNRNYICSLVFFINVSFFKCITDSHNLFHTSVVLF